MRRPILRLIAVFGGAGAWMMPAWAEEFQPFAQQVSQPEAAAPMTPAPQPFPPEVPLGEQTPSLQRGQYRIEGQTEWKEYEYEVPAHDAHAHPEHHEHHAHHEHHHHAHHHEHEEPLGNLRVTPLYREIESDIWDSVFDTMYSVNVGTTFWQPEHHHGYFNTQVGLVTEFQYSSLDGESDTTINSVVSVPFAIREIVRVKEADIYAGNIGLSFVANTYLPDSCNKLELGFTPLLTIGNLNADLERSAPFGPSRDAVIAAITAYPPLPPGTPQGDIILGRRASDNGTIVGGDFRVWTGIKTESGFRAGITGFYGVAQTDAIFDSSRTFNTYGGGVYVEMPTRFIPHEFPAPVGAFQWIEEIFHLH